MKPDSQWILVLGGSWDKVFTGLVGAPVTVAFKIDATITIASVKESFSTQTMYITFTYKSGPVYYFDLDLVQNTNPYIVFKIRFNYSRPESAYAQAKISNINIPSNYFVDIRLYTYKVLDIL